MTLIPGIVPVTAAAVNKQATAVGGPTQQMSIEDLLKTLGVINPAAPNVPLTQTTSHIPGTGVPMPQRQYPEIKRDEREFATKSGNRRVAQNNLFGNITSVITTAQKNREAQEMRNLAVDLERLMTAAQNPNDPANQQIIIDMLSDKKKAKSIAKALNINFMGDQDKRSNVEKGAYDMAVKKLQGSMGKPDFASQLGRLLGAPTGQTISPQMQAMAALTQAGVLPSADQKMKSGVDIAKQLDTSATKRQLMQYFGQIKDKEMATRLKTALINLKGKAYVAEVLAGASRYRTAAIYQAQHERTVVLQSKIDDAIKRVGNNTQLKNALEQAKTLNTAVEQLAEQVKNTPSSWWNDNKEQAQARLKEYQDARTKLENAIINANKLGANIPLVGGGDANQSNTGNQSTGTIGGGTGNTDDGNTADQDFTSLINEFNQITGENFATPD